MFQRKLKLFTSMTISILIISVITFIFIFSGILSGQEQEKEEEKISSFGKYEGFSPERFDSFVRSSQYLTMRDGTKIAIDIIRPAVDGKPVEEPATGAYPFREWSPSGFVEEINASGVPMYIWGGWFDSFTKDTFLIYKNFTTPRKLTIGARSHAPRDENFRREEYNLLAVEQLRWFDYWLKGTDNGIMEEPPIRYQVMEKPGLNRWEIAQEWPLRLISK